MSFIGLVLLMALVLAVLSVITFMSRVVTALERIEQMVEQLVDARGGQPGDSARHDQQAC